MLFKKFVVRALVDITDGWNKEIHDAIESKVLAGYQQTFPPSADDDIDQRNKRLSNMREFYYARMAATASILISTIALLVAVAAFVIQMIN